MPTVRSSCKKDEVPITTVWLGFGLFAFTLPFLLYVQRKCNEPRGGIQHMMYNRRRYRQRRRRDRERDTTRDLTLAGWHDHCELHKLELGDVELKTCYLQLQDTKLPIGIQPESSAAISSSDDTNESELWHCGGEELEMVAAPERVSDHFNDQEESESDGDGENDLNSTCSASKDREQERVSVSVDNC